MWTGVAGTPYYSNFFLDDDGTNVQQALDQTETLLQEWIATAALGLVYTIEDAVTVLDTATGQPTTVVTGTGTTDTAGGGSDPLPWGNQVLIRLNTGVFQNGRQIIGHHFIPGMIEGHVGSDGLLTTTRAGELATAQDEYSTTPGNLTEVVWSRASNSAPPVASVAANRHLTFLRSRRD